MATVSDGEVLSNVRGEAEPAATAVPDEYEKVTQRAEIYENDTKIPIEVRIALLLCDLALLRPPPPGKYRSLSVEELEVAFFETLSPPQKKFLEARRKVMQVLRSLRDASYLRLS